MTRELESYETERFRSMGRHLELMWNFNQVPPPVCSHALLCQGFPQTAQIEFCGPSCQAKLHIVQSAENYPGR